MTDTTTIAGMQPTRTILMLAGWSGCGKDAAASLMVEEMGFQRFAFADAVKQECAILYGLPVDRFYLSKDRPLERHIHRYPTARTPRELLLLHALDERAKDDTIYARMVVNDIRDSEADRIVISDWRYRVELDTMRSAFPDARIVTVRIQRPGIQQSTHPSEHELDTMIPRFTLRNDGTISDLRDALKALLRHQSMGSLTHSGS